MHAFLSRRGLAERTRSERWGARVAMSRESAMLQVITPRIAKPEDNVILEVLYHTFIYVSVFDVK